MRTLEDKEFQGVTIGRELPAHESPKVELTEARLNLRLEEARLSLKSASDLLNGGEEPDTKEVAEKRTALLAEAANLEQQLESLEKAAHYTA